MNICILGAGSWGTALAMVLADNGHDVKMWTRRLEHCNSINIEHENKKYLGGIKLSDKIVATTDIKEAIRGSKVVLTSVASQSTREVLERTEGIITSEQIIVNVSKGIEIKTLKRMSEVVSEFYPHSKYVVLSGPSHAEEVALKLPTTLVSASSDIDSARLVQDLFITDYIRVYTNPDVIGVELGGALKNIIALGAGIGDGMGYGDNSKAALMTRGISEITRLGQKMGANMHSFSGLTGIGDLIVTCTSMHSRNRRCGILIGSGKKVDDAIAEIGMVVEGIYTIQSAYNLSLKYNVDMPLTHGLYKIVYEGADPKKIVNALMTRAKKNEVEEKYNWF